MTGIKSIRIIDWFWFCNSLLSILDQDTSNNCMLAEFRVLNGERRKVRVDRIQLLAKISAKVKFG